SYVRDSFLYRILNTVLRIKDIDCPFEFRLLIKDTFEQLKHFNSNHHNQESIIHVYRDQIISSKELNESKSNIGEFISLNSLLSTSKNRNVTGLFVSEEPKDRKESILFEIQVDTRLSTKTFADILFHYH
ncbi:unnamed protein product, partial [Didymodactylos carnosus]